MTKRISSLDVGYSIGNLSVYPETLDNKETLYEVKNNAETKLKQSVSYNAKYVIVENNDNFPDQGLIRIGPPPGNEGPAEIIYYSQKQKGIFKGLIRGFAGSRQNPWSINSYVINSVMAEHHNAIRDAIIQIERNLGTEESPSIGSLNEILKFQEIKFLAPKAIFRAHVIKGPPPLKVRFQNFSTGPLIRYLWDFGDRTTSIEKNPIHVYQNEGIYSVQLNIISSLGAQGVTSKLNYITVSEEERIPFFYVSKLTGISQKTADDNSIDPTNFRFVDQTDGNIIQRYWIFDGPGKNDENTVEQSLEIIDPNIHEINFIYDLPGNYEPSLLTLFENQKLKRAFLRESITVT